MCDLTNINIIKILFITSQNADPAPPLGTVLGNLGLNTIKFCKEFNAITSTLPKYFKLKVKIFIFDNRSFQCHYFYPSTGFILNLLKFSKDFKVFKSDRFITTTFFCISLKNLIKLALFKFPLFDLSQSLPVILGSIKSMKLKVIV